MRAARMFALRLAHDGLLSQTARVVAELYGSLGATGKGHGSDKAVLLGLEGDEPDTVDVEAIAARIAAIRGAGRLRLLGLQEVAFDEKNDLLFYRVKSLPFHANGMILHRFRQRRCASSRSAIYYSVGGGFVVSDELAADGTRARQIAPDTTVLPLPFHSGAQLLEQCTRKGVSIAGIMRINEQPLARRRADRRRARCTSGRRCRPASSAACAATACCPAACASSAAPPRCTAASRRCTRVRRAIRSRSSTGSTSTRSRSTRRTPPAAASSRRRPTVRRASCRRCCTTTRATCRARAPTGVRDFLLTAGAIGLLYKENASISGAEVGCQGEVGVACSMAAGALCAVLGGTPAQVENAAEIGMEHNLGLTCDPVGGLVQIPCIERNAIASVKAINAARMALAGDGTHYVSLDQVIKTMRDTGADMQTKYKETARGGLAVNVIEC